MTSKTQNTSYVVDIQTDGDVQDTLRDATSLAKHWVKDWMKRAAHGEYDIGSSIARVTRIVEDEDKGLHEERYVYLVWVDIDGDGEIHETRDHDKIRRHSYEAGFIDRENKRSWETANPWRKANQYGERERAWATTHLQEPLSRYGNRRSRRRGSRRSRKC